MFLARVERGEEPSVFPVDSKTADLPNQASHRTHGGQRDKARMRIAKRKPSAWLFKLGGVGARERIGAAAIDTTDVRAIASAMRLLSSYYDAKSRR